MLLAAILDPRTLTSALFAPAVPSLLAVVGDGISSPAAAAIAAMTGGMPSAPTRA